MALFKGLNQNVTTAAPDYAMMGAAGVIKYTEERLLAPIIGNGTIKSGLIKIVGGVASKELVGGFWGNSAALGFTTDGIEDCLTAVLGSSLNNVISGISGVTGISAGNSSRPAWAA